MDLTEIPFVKQIGIEKDNEGRMRLELGNRVLNHLQTVHAGAQYALAETASGEMLRILLPELSGRALPVLRDSRIKFRRPAATSLTAHAEAAADNVSRFEDQLERKGRALISISVELKDTAGATTATGVFDWFVQRTDGEPT